MRRRLERGRLGGGFLYRLLTPWHEDDAFRELARDRELAARSRADVDRPAERGTTEHDERLALVEPHGSKPRRRRAVEVDGRDPNWRTQNGRCEGGSRHPDESMNGPNLKVNVK
jgi:hypothetical protein